MRQLHVHVPKGSAERIARIGKSHGAAEPLILTTRHQGGEDRESVVVELPNDRTGAFVEEVTGALDDVRFVFFPSGAIAITPPVGEVRERVKDVSRRSTLELVLSALQSLGSWWGMLVYAVLSGTVAAYATLFNIGYLLIAAMLIAPMGAPAMVCVVGSTIGDLGMLRRGALRFWVAVVVLAAMAALLGFLYGAEVSTATMEQVSSLSAWTVVLALAGGAAGAQALARSDRDSLVSGTAAGFLVAVSLSPPAAVLGLSVAMQRWDYTQLMAFLLVLTFAGIIVGGWVSLALFGIAPEDMTTKRGARRWRYVIAAAALVAVAGFVAWQTTLVPRFVKADLSSDAVKLTRSAVAELGDIHLVEAAAHFTRSDLRRVPGEGLVVAVLVQRDSSADVSGGAEQRVRAAVTERLRREMPGVAPLVTVTVLPP